MGCSKIGTSIAGSGRNYKELLLRLSLGSFLNTTWNSSVICKQQVSNKSVIIGGLIINPCIINTLGGEIRERSRSRAELSSRPPGEHFYLSPFTEIVWKRHDSYPRQVFVCMESEDTE